MSVASVGQINCNSKKLFFFFTLNMDFLNRLDQYHLQDLVIIMILQKRYHKNYLMLQNVMDFFFQKKYLQLLM